MFALRRIATRSFAAPSLSAPVITSKRTFILSRSSSIAFSQIGRSYQAQTPVPPFQRRWASNEATSGAAEEVAETRQEPAADTEVVDAPAVETPDQAEAVEAAGEIAEVSIGQEAAIASQNKSSPASEALGEDADMWTIRREREHEQQQPASVVDKTAVFIGNMFFDVTEKMLQERFEEYGEIDTVKIAIDRRGLSRGFGWVHFKDEEAAQRAMSGAHNRMWEGRLMAVMPAERKERPNRVPGGKSLSHRAQNPPSSTLFIGNLSYEMTDTDLNDLFQPIRNVIDVRVAIDRRTGQPRGFAHADFINTESAEEAAKILAEKKIYGRQLRVDFSTSVGPSRTAERQRQ